MCCWKIQDGERERRVHGLRNRDILGYGRCKRFVDLLDVSFELKCTDLELGECCLFV